MGYMQVLLIALAFCYLQVKKVRERRLLPDNIIVFAFGMISGKDEVRLELRKKIILDKIQASIETSNRLRK